MLYENEVIKSPEKIIKKEIVQVSGEASSNVSVMCFFLLTADRQTVLPRAASRMGHISSTGTL